MATFLDACEDLSFNCSTVLQSPESPTKHVFLPIIHISACLSSAWVGSTPRVPPVHMCRLSSLTLMVLICMQIHYVIQGSYQNHAALTLSIL